MSIALVNGLIYTSFKPLKTCSGLLAWNGRVVATGSSEHILELARAMRIPVFDLKGMVVLPGFVDAHMHIDTLGLVLNSLDLRNVRSIGELKERLRAYSSRAKTRWVLGHGWDHENFEEKRWPTRWDIDEVVHDRPVLLTRVCLHAGVVNTVALEETKVLNARVRGVLRDDRGEPTGVLVEEALKYVREYVKRNISVEEYEELVKTAQEHLLANGVTTVGVTGCSTRVLKALFNLWRRGELRVRTRVYIYPYDAGEPVYELLARIGVRAGFGDEYFRILGVKLFADGALGARTAWLSEPYSDDPSTTGYPVTPVEELARIARHVDKAGLQLAVHAIGDKAVETVISVYRELGNLKVLRHRVEHASLVRDDVLDELADLKPVVAVQPRFVISDWWALSRVGLERVKWLYRFKSMLERGIPLALSTDAPVEPVNPWETVYAAVTRGRYENILTYSATEHESLGIQDALHLYTYGSAYALHSESEVGRLEPGMLADFVVVDKDPLKVAPQELRSIRVIEVYVGGERVWPK